MRGLESRLRPQLRRQNCLDHWRPPNQGWSTDLCRIRAGKDCRAATLALVMACRSRKLSGLHLSHSSKDITAISPLEHALIASEQTLKQAV